MNHWHTSPEHVKCADCLAQNARVRELEAALTEIETRARMAQNGGNVSPEAEAYILRGIMRDIEGLAALNSGEETNG